LSEYGNLAERGGVKGDSMGEFYAWAMTGQVTGLDVWSDANDRMDGEEEPSDEGSSVRIATRLLKQQKFTLRSRDGRDMDVHLVESGVSFENGQFATLAWAAREGAQHGHCVFATNHSTGAEARLLGNLRHIRSELNAGKIASFGFLAAMPAALAILAWLLTPGGLADVDMAVFLVGASIALVVLFAVGAIVAKLVFDYMRSEDDEKIWLAVDRALALSYQQTQRPISRLERRTLLR
jgi:hypothetical protein